MPIRTALTACAFALGTLTGAYAGDNYGGFGPSENSETQAISSNEGVPPESQQTLPWLQPQSGDQPGAYGSQPTQQGAADSGYDMDDEGGH